MIILWAVLAGIAVMLYCLAPVKPRYSLLIITAISTLLFFVSYHTVLVKETADSAAIAIAMVSSIVWFLHAGLYGLKKILDYYYSM